MIPLRIKTSDTAETLDDGETPCMSSEKRAQPCPLLKEQRYSDGPLVAHKRPAGKGPTPKINSYRLPKGTVFFERSPPAELAPC